MSLSKPREKGRHFLSISDFLHNFYFFFIFFLLLNSVYTVLPLSQGLDIGLNGGTIHMKTVKYVHTKLCLSVYNVTEYY